MAVPALPSPAKGHRVNITQNDVLDLIRQTRAGALNPEGAMTVTEIVRESGMNIQRVRAELRRSIADGRVEVVRVYRPAVDGTMRPSPAYRVKP